MIFRHRRLRAAIDALPEAQKLYATLSLCEGVADGEIADLLVLDARALRVLREETEASLSPQLPFRRGERARLTGTSEQTLKERLERFASHPLDRAGRAPTTDDVLLETVPAAERAAAIADVREGDGGELRQPKDSTLAPRFHSARSSCALAVNVFGPWRRDQSSLRISGLGGFTSLQFERRCPVVGVTRGTPPNLDVLAEGETVVGIESKLIEHISAPPKKAFSDAYARAVDELADEPWRDAVNRLRKGGSGFETFDATQVLKHYLGLKTRYGERPTVIVYLYWEPRDAQQRFFAWHREEVREFCRWVAGGDVQFLPLRLSQLLDRWSSLAEPAWLQEHIRLVRERYAVA